MAILYADRSGQILRVLRGEADETRWPDPPSGTVTTLTFDPVTNAAMLLALDTDWENHAVSGGVLVRGGVPVVFNADGQAFQDRQALATLQSKLDADQSLTAAEMHRLLRWIVHRLL